MIPHFNLLNSDSLRIRHVVWSNSYVSCKNWNPFCLVKKSLWCPHGAFLLPADFPYVALSCDAVRKSISFWRCSVHILESFWTLKTPQPKWVPHRGIVWSVMRNRRLCFERRIAKNKNNVLFHALWRHTAVFVGNRASQIIRMHWKGDFRQI